MRNSRGALLALVGACGFVLALFIVSIFCISMILGGEREVQNATDAGALNIGKEVFVHRSFKVDLPANSPFRDVSDKNGQVGLANVNAVWGKTLLVVANAQEMNTDGLAGDSAQNADMIFANAKAISNELADKLNDERNHYPIFEQLAEKNSVRMLGGNCAISADRNADYWRTSLVGRGQPSNIEVPTKDVLPTDAIFDGLNATQSRLPGYTPIAVGGRVFCFVPFTPEERTHLISHSVFTKDTVSEKPLNGPEWGTPVPNAFSCKGTAVNQSSYAQKSVACVLTNPQKVYRLSNPHSFIRVRLGDNDAQWLFNSPDPRVNGYNIGLSEKNSNYAYRPDMQDKSGGGGSAVDGRLEGRVVPLGLEYTQSPSLDTALFGSDRENGNRARLETVLVRRINQMLSEVGSKFTAEDLHNLLSRPETGAMLAETDFYIFSPNGSSIEVGRREDAIARAPWMREMIDREPDGNERTLLTVSSDVPLPPGPVMVDPLPGANIVVPAFGRLNVEINDSWRPGSGYNGCLGTVTVDHRSKVYIWGVAIIPVAPGAGLLERLFDW